MFGSKTQIMLSILTDALIVPQSIADHYVVQIYPYTFNRNVCQDQSGEQAKVQTQQGSSNIGLH